MRRLKLNPTGYATTDDDTYDRLSVWKWQRDRRGYATRKDWKSGRTVKMHREVMQAPDGIEVDHINPRQTCNNQRYNLRFATHAQNMANQTKHKDNKSGYKGVCWDKERHLWIASIGINYRVIRIGRYTTARKAARAYDEYAVKHLGEFARTNFPIARRAR